ncbi:iron-containing alcohol dehydrogenase family protein, partial [Stomatohabitans albus]
MAVSYHPTAVHMGEDAMDTLTQFSGQRVLIITDAFLATTDLVANAKARLGQHVHIFDGVIPDPTTETVAEIVRMSNQVRPEVVIAIGGGSPIDAAKGGLLAINHNGHSPTFIVIPTTCGSGSEVTPFTIITDQNGTKNALVTDDVLPEIAILTPEAVATLPAHIAAETGMDALTHCFEAYTSTDAQIFSDMWAMHAIELLFTHLVPSYQGNQESREIQLYASTMAGFAFSEAGLGIVHSMAHATGARLHLVHGRINSVLLPRVLAFNAGLPNPSTPEELRVVQRLAAVADHIGIAKQTPVESANAVINRIVEIRQTLGIADTLTGLGASEAPSPALFDDL